LSDARPDTPSWEARFEDFVREKTRAADEARLAPYVSETDTPPETARRVGNAWSERLFDGPFYVSPARSPRRPSCSLVFVQSADGNTGAADPATLGGGETDKHLIYEGLSRVSADAVLAGAGTVRGTSLIFSVWHPELVRLRASLGLPRHPVQIVTTLRGLDLDGLLLFNVPEIPVVLVTAPAAASTIARSVEARPWVTVLPIAGPGELPRAFEQLRSMGHARISCIGGRTLARTLLDTRLVDEVYLTTAARPGGEPATPLHVKPWRGVAIARKHGTGPDAGVVFEHFLAAG
jgi:riboflavin biosynthesis pyrimidine reductase